MLGIGEELDKRISSIREIETVTENDLQNIVETHKFLTDAFSQITDDNKRSFTSLSL